ncbi:unnamed protein product, partial [Rangifer tarandus platyrhynchus]
PGAEPTCDPRWRHSGCASELVGGTDQGEPAQGWRGGSGRGLPSGSPKQEPHGAGPNGLGRVHRPSCACGAGTCSSAGASGPGFGRAGGGSQARRRGGRLGAGRFGLLSPSLRAAWR